MCNDKRLLTGENQWWGLTTPVWLDQRCKPEPLYQVPSSAGLGRENTGQDKGKERSLTNHLMDKTDSTWGICLFITIQIRVG